MKSVEQIRKYLGQVPFFQDLGEGELARMAGAARYRTLERGAFFFHEGDPADRLYVLAEGRVRLNQLSAEGQQVLLRFVCAGEPFGWIGCLVGTAYPASAEAADDCAAIYWDNETITAIMEDHPRLAMAALRMLARQVQEMQERYRELATERVERRLARALLRLSSQTGNRVPGGILLDIRLSRQDLAEMTGTTLYTVSRILSRWEQAGLVKSRRERVLIRQPEGLVDVAEDTSSAASGDDGIAPGGGLA
jgi:CRP/FNR family transcriptional regulator, nitrogen oxide reductase regulator